MINKLIYLLSQNRCVPFSVKNDTLFQELLTFDDSPLNDEPGVLKYINSKLFLYYELGMSPLTHQFDL